jgi:formylglycine-generating enzyme required for sulfatase activity
MGIIGKDGWPEKTGYDWRNPGFKQSALHPVVGVSWEDATAFCQWLTEKERNEGLLSSRQFYRLPTDHEWSCAAGTTKYPWGDAWPPSKGAGNYAGAEAGEVPWPRTAESWDYSDGFAWTSPVGSFDPNQYGIFDLGGNVWEGCEDWYRKEMSPSDLRAKYDWLNDDGGGQHKRVFRGAAWSHRVADFMLSAYRCFQIPGFRCNDIGFRVVLTLDSSAEGALESIKKLSRVFFTQEQAERRAAAERVSEAALALDRQTILGLCQSEDRGERVAGYVALRSHLSQLGPGIALEAICRVLRKGLSDGEPRVRYRVIQAIGAHSAFRNPFCADLKRLAESDPNDAVRDLASELHKKAGSPGEIVWENSLGMKFVSVPGTEVWFSTWLTRVRDFAAFADATGHSTGDMLEVLGEDGWREQPGYNWRSPGFPQGPEHPVVGVSWDDAQAFCRWLTKREQQAGLLPVTARYRLPTDAEWSCAAGPSRFPWGDDWPPPSGAGNYAGTEVRESTWPAGWETIEGYNDGFVRTSPVGSFKPNLHGLYDLGGNVWEWCEDWFRKEVHTEETRKELAWYTELNDDGGGQRYRILRGSTWGHARPSFLATAFRSPKPPQRRVDDAGFRVVLELNSPLHEGSPKLPIASFAQSAKNDPSGHDGPQSNQNSYIISRNRQFLIESK